MFRYVFFYSVLLVSLGTNQVVAEPQPRFFTAAKVTGSELYNQTVCLKRDNKGTCSKAGLVVEQTTGVADIDLVEFSYLKRDDRYGVRDSEKSRCESREDQWMCAVFKNGKLTLSPDEADDAALTSSLQYRVEYELVKDRIGSNVFSVDGITLTRSYGRTYYFFTNGSKADPANTQYCYTAQLSGIQLDENLQPIGERKVLGTQNQCVLKGQAGMWILPPMRLHKVIEMKIVRTEKNSSRPPNSSSTQVAEH